MIPKLTTQLACRVADIPRDHFNEAVSSGFFGCAPVTVAGRARVFDPDDMLTLHLYSTLLKDGETKTRAGRVACAVGAAARENRAAPVIAYAEDYFRGQNGAPSGQALPADMVPAHGDWDRIGLGGTNIRKVTLFNVAYEREIIAARTTEEISVFGSED